MSKRQLLLMSSSRVDRFKYLEHARDDIERFLKKNNVSKVLFIPFALKDHEEYTRKVSEPLQQWGFQVEGLHTKSNEIEAIKTAEAIFVGGGNTFVLLKALYEKKLIPTIVEQVMKKGVPYIGSSAGTNVATRSIHTTNDMPVAYPPSFEALQLVPFNINPHYIDDHLNGHQGETRDQRLQEFIDYHGIGVLGLREGTSIRVDGDTIMLLGLFNAKWFNKSKETSEYAPGADLSFLLTE